MEKKKRNKKDLPIYLSESWAFSFFLFYSLESPPRVFVAICKKRDKKKGKGDKTNIYFYRRTRVYEIKANLAPIWFHVPCSTLLAYTHCRLIGSSVPSRSRTNRQTVERSAPACVSSSSVHITIFVSFFLCRSVSVSFPFSKGNPQLKVASEEFYFYFFVFFFFVCFYLIVTSSCGSRENEISLMLGVLCGVLTSTRLLHPTCIVIQHDWG